MDETDHLINEILHDRELGTEDSWWRDRISDHLRDMGKYGNSQDLADKDRILRLPRVERELIAAAMHRAILRRALQPFVDFCRQIDASKAGAAASDDKMIHPGLTVGDFRRAVLALRETQE